MISKTTIQIYQVIDQFRKNPYQLMYYSKEILKKIEYYVTNNIPLTLILPACHGKADNKSYVVSGTPDMGEYLGIENFASLCREIATVYKLGANMIVASEGHFHADTPLIKSDVEMEKYTQLLRKLIAKHPSLSCISITDFFPLADSYSQCRKLFNSKYSPTLEHTKKLMESNHIYLDLYTNYKTMYTNFLLFNFASKSKIRKISRAHALKHLSKYLGFNRLLKSHFSRQPYIKFSALYKGPEILDQISINYLTNQHHMSTPLFNMVIRSEKGDYSFIKSSEAIKRGALLREHEGLYYYQEISTDYLT